MSRITDIKEFLSKIIFKTNRTTFGCSEIGVLVYAAALCSEALESKNYKKVEITISPYIYRNLLNVSVPFLKKIDIKTIVAAGLIMQRSQYQLGILKWVKDEHIQKIYDLGKSPIYEINFCNDDPVYCKIIVEDEKGNIAESLIENDHELVRYVKLNNKILQEDKTPKYTYGTEHYKDDSIDAKTISLRDCIEVVDLFNSKDISF